LSVLITSKKPGDEVTLTVVREAKPQALKTKLIEKEITVGGGPMAGNVMWEAAALPQLGAGGGGGGFGGFAGGGDVMVFQDGAGGARTTRLLVQNLNGNMTTQWADDQHNITVERQGDQVNRVVVKDRASDKVIFEGDPAKADQLAPELKDKIKKAQDAGAGVPGMNNFNIGVAPNAFGGARGKVMTWQGDEQIFFLRMMGKTPTYLLALSKKDGRVLYDGPTMTDEQRKSLPAEVSEQFELIMSKPEMVKEFGVAGK
jgi:hypothetical protein